MYYLGLDIGSSSVKCAIVTVPECRTLASIRYPESEMKIHSPKPGWAEQHPDDWWEACIQAISLTLKKADIQGNEIAAIGISYQMHGLVLVDKKGKVVRPSIIWCDSRAVESGNELASRLPDHVMHSTLYNHPGNFTASKLLWLKENENISFHLADKVMLPGDYIAFKLTGRITTSLTGLSEAILYDFKANRLSEDMLLAGGFPAALFPDAFPSIHPTSFTNDSLTSVLGIPEGIPITYRAGDQPNNAWSLGITDPGEAAATAGTSGVVYAVSEKVIATNKSGLNSFAHVNHTPDHHRIGNLLCINGVGIVYSWLRSQFFPGLTYEQLNELASSCHDGSDGIIVLPFGNGVERMLDNQTPGMSIHHLDLNRHTKAHIARACLEGVAFAFCYGIEKMKKAGIPVHNIRAGNDNLFQSGVFRSAVAQVSECRVTLYDTNGAVGAAIGAAVGSGCISAEHWKATLKEVDLPEREIKKEYLVKAYEEWKRILATQIVDF